MGGAKETHSRSEKQRVGPNSMSQCGGYLDEIKLPEFLPVEIDSCSYLFLLSLKFLFILRYIWIIRIHRYLRLPY